MREYALLKQIDIDLGGPYLSAHVEIVPKLRLDGWDVLVLVFLRGTGAKIRCYYGVLAPEKRDDSFGRFGILQSELCRQLLRVVPVKLLMKQRGD